MNDLGQRIRECREAQKMTRRDLSLHLDVAPNTLAQWEYGTREPSIATLVQIADLFNVTTDYLIGRTDKPMEEKQIGKDTIVLTTEKDAPSEDGAPRVTGTASADLPASAEQLRPLVRQLVAEALSARQAGQ